MVQKVSCQSLDCESDKVIFSLFQMDEDKPTEPEKSSVNPWLSSTVEGLLKKINAQLVKYDVRFYPFSLA